jgi:glycosyltransferase involved in cell wall biosynthesis
MRRTVVHVSDSLEFGGTEQVILQLLEGLDGCRWRNVLFHQPSRSRSLLADAAEALGAEHHAWQPQVSWAGLSQVIPLVQQLRSIRPSVMHVHLTDPLACRFVLAAGALARVPAIIATQHLFADLSTTWSRTQHRVVASMVHRYITVSNDGARKLHGRLGVPRRKIRVVRNGIRLERFEPSSRTSLRTMLTGGKDAPVVLTVARLEPHKGHQFLLSAIASVPNARFVFAGDGSLRATLERMAYALGVSDRVLFLGHRNDVPELLANCDLFVLPSVYEGLPLAMLEAMAEARPVIATAIGGVDEVVTDGQTGLMVQPTDPAALATAIQTVIANPQLAQTLGTNGRELVRSRFRAELMVRGVAAVYDELLA